MEWVKYTKYLFLAARFRGEGLILSRLLRASTCSTRCPFDGVLINVGMGFLRTVIGTKKIALGLSVKCVFFQMLDCCPSQLAERGVALSCTAVQFKDRKPC